MQLVDRKIVSIIAAGQANGGKEFAVADSVRLGVEGELITASASHSGFALMIGGALGTLHGDDPPREREAETPLMRVRLSIG